MAAASLARANLLSSSGVAVEGALAPMVLQQRHAYAPICPPQQAEDEEDAQAAAEAAEQIYIQVGGMRQLCKREDAQAAAEAAEQAAESADYGEGGGWGECQEMCPEV
ncbi:hypothetical protein T492DRAFT_841110 [Pavlovales sp. CCMP2436]|nr:hypothetical protein T492DRAFT_841110 [Pavlovales sp. CCMP2436]